MKLLLHILFILFVVLSFSFNSFAQSRSSNTLMQDIQIFQETVNAVLRNYIHDVEHTDIIRGAIKGLLKELNDPYSYYMPPKEHSDMVERLDSEFGGLGIQIGIVNDQLTIIAPLDETPADRAGLRAKDRIIKIEGESTAGITTEEAANKMRGPRGTQVTITVERDENGKTTVTDYTITRDIIRIRMSNYRITEDNIGYIRIVSYTRNIHEEVEEAIAALNKRNVKGMILDLRHNPGGYLHSAVNVASFFTDKKKLVVYTKGRNERILAQYESVRTNEKYLDPLIVLVDKGSASASEITAGALKDWGRAVLVGETTFGKGSVQQVYNMLDNSGLRLTIAKYYTPSKTLIHNNGVKPHITVSLPSSEEIRRIMEEEREKQRQKENQSEENPQSESESEKLNHNVDNDNNFHKDNKNQDFIEKEYDVDNGNLKDIEDYDGIDDYVDDDAPKRRDIQPLEVRPHDTQLKFALDLLRTFKKF